VIVVGDVVGDRGDLCLEARPAGEVEVEAGVGLGEGPWRGGYGAVVLGEALECLPRQVEPVEVGVDAFEAGHEAERVGVVVEPAEVIEAALQRFLAAMAERRVAEVVGET